MKAILKNNKYLALTIASIAVILAVIIAIPTVFALNDNSGEIVKKQEQEGIVEKEEQKTDVTKKEDIISTPENIKAPADAVVATENTADNYETENQFFKITDKTIILGNITFDFQENKYDEVINKKVDVYRSKNLDQIIVDSQTRDIYSVYLFNDLYINSIKLNSPNENELKLTAQQFAAKLCGDIKRYNSNSVVKLDSGGYDVCFMRKINGYDTSEWITVGFDENLNIWSYRREPNVFDDADISNIAVDEDKINQNIAEVYKERYGENYGTFEIKYQQITVKNSEIILETGISALNKLGDPISQSALDLFEFVVG